MVISGASLQLSARNLLGELIRNLPQIPLSKVLAAKTIVTTDFANCVSDAARLLIPCCLSAEYVKAACPTCDDVRCPEGQECGMSDGLPVCLPRVPGGCEEDKCGDQGKNQLSVSGYGHGRIHQQVGFWAGRAIVVGDNFYLFHVVIVGTILTVTVSSVD